MYYYALTHYLFSNWPKAYSEFFEISACDIITAEYTIIKARKLKVKGNPVVDDRGA